MKARTRAATRAFAAFALAGCALAGCAGKPSPAGGSASSSAATTVPSASSEEPASLEEWGTWTPTQEGRGIFRSERLGLEIELPGEPDIQPPAEGDEFEMTRLRVEAGGSTGVSVLVTVEKVTPEQNERLAAMDDSQELSELGYYVQQMVGSAEYVEALAELPLDGHPGLRYRASNYDADLWTVLGEDHLYTVATYGLDEYTNVIVFGSMNVSG